jgi:hypothetical protein
LSETFDNDSLTEAYVIEEVDPICSELSINQLNFTAINYDMKFNMINPDGIYAYLQTNQTITAKVKVSLEDGSYESIPLGVFYLSEWENPSALTTSIEAVDLVGMLDTSTYYNSSFWVNETLEDVITAILSDAGDYTCEISNELADEVVNGYVPVCSHREALQYVLVACRATAKVNRFGVLVVFRPDFDTTIKDVDFDTMIGEASISQKELVNSVEVTEYTYTLGTTSETISEEDYSFTGTAEKIIEFNDAVDADSLTFTIESGATIDSKVVSATSAQLTITATEDFTLTITGYTYSSSTTTVQVTLDSVSSYDTLNTATISDNPLICNNGEEVADHVLDYYTHRIEQSFYWSCDPAVEAGDCVSVETIFGTTYPATIESQEITFSPCLKSSVEGVG